MQCFNDCQLKSYNFQSEFAKLQVPCQWSFLDTFLFDPNSKVDTYELYHNHIIHPSSAQMEQVKALVTALLAVKANCQSICFYSFFLLLLFFFSFAFILSVLFFTVSISAVVKNLYGGIYPHFSKEFDSKSWICNACLLPECTSS